MLKKFSVIFFAFLAAACSKVDGIATETICFTANLDDTRTVLDGKSVKWEGTEDLYVWYRNGAGAVGSSKAAFKKIDGTSAVFSVSLPAGTLKDEFYAEVNGVKDDSAEMRPFGSKGPRTYTLDEQRAVAGSYDPAALGLGARWKKSGTETTPSFSFKNLHNVLKISVDNQVGKDLDSIVLTTSTPIVCRNYWKIDDSGAVTHQYSAGTGTRIRLTGPIAPGKADYCFVVAVKNDYNSNIKIKDMTLTFHCGEGFYKTSNGNTLEIGRNTLVTIGSFKITAGGLTFPKGAPFGTYWDSSFLKAWNVAGFQANVPFEGLAAYDTRQTPTALARASASSSLLITSPGGEYAKGKFWFEFVSASTGRGVLTFTSSPGSNTGNHGAGVYCNGKKVDGFNYPANYNKFERTAEFDVKFGDVICIQYENPSSNAKIYCGGVSGTGDSAVDLRIRWERGGSAEGGLSSPEDLSSDDSSSYFFNEL